MSYKGGSDRTDGAAAAGDWISLKQMRLTGDQHGDRPIEAAGDDGSCATRNAHAAAADVPGAAATYTTAKRWPMRVYKVSRWTLAIVMIFVVGPGLLPMWASLGLILLACLAFLREIAGLLLAPWLARPAHFRSAQNED